jgi:hypothetical protein
VSLRMWKVNVLGLKVGVGDDQKANGQCRRPMVASGVLSL